MKKTRIEWADLTWNPISGCSKISEGCEHCYAERMAKRLAGRCGYIKEAPFCPVYHENQLLQPLAWRRRYRVFVGSMGDLFHEAFGDVVLDQIFAVMAMAPRHTFFLLTKRPERMYAYLLKKDRAEAIGWAEQIVTGELAKKDLPVACDYKGPQHRSLPLPNVWLGVTAENQRTADERIPTLLSTPAAKRFVSVEPMLSEIKLNEIDVTNFLNLGTAYKNAMTGQTYVPGGGSVSSTTIKGEKLDWVICGGETGPGARPMHPDWVRGLRDQCQNAEVPFFFKGWGDWVPMSTVGGIQKPPFGDYGFSPSGALSGYARQKRRILKSRILDGRTWEEFPEANHG